MDNAHLLIELAKYSKNGFIEANTTSISKLFGLSQQSISRKLIELERQRLIKRVASNRGTKVIIDNEGKRLLAEKYAALKSYFESSKAVIKGKVKTGLGEGRYYMSQEGYIMQFVEKLGFKPYPGTLNIDVDAMQALAFINSLTQFRINGFDSKERTFGALTAYKVKVKDIECGVVIPDRTTHDRSTLEVISPYYLRDKLGLKDADEITIIGE